tara:strand:- start:936 stop:1328 length:393 start_codon:yes stop_codon:yes gene_type:complete
MSYLAIEAKEGVEDKVLEHIRMLPVDTAIVGGEVLWVDLGVATHDRETNVVFVLVQEVEQGERREVGTSQLWVVGVQVVADLSVEVKTLAAESLVGMVAGSMTNGKRAAQIRELPEMQLYPHDERRHLLA